MSHTCGISIMTTKSISWPKVSYRWSQYQCIIWHWPLILEITRLLPFITCHYSDQYLLQLRDWNCDITGSKSDWLLKINIYSVETVPILCICILRSVKFSLYFEDIWNKNLFLKSIASNIFFMTLHSFSVT